MGNNQSGDCFRTDKYYFYGNNDLRFCERFGNSPEYVNCISALIISLIGFYNLFFYHHDMSVLRFVSSSIMFNGIMSFINHWNGRREWLFMDNISIILSVSLLTKITIEQFIENYDYVIITSSSKNKIAKRYGRAASLSIQSSSDKDNDGGGGGGGGPASLTREISISHSTTEVAPSIVHRYDFIARPISNLFGWILCLLLIFFLIIYNIQGCTWNNYTKNKNTIFIIFILVIPIIIFLLLILFYFKAKSMDRQPGLLLLFLKHSK